jgi:hypothetical protein
VGQAHFDSLTNLKRQVYLGALAGLYYQWECDLRSFLDNEFHFDESDQASIDKRVWKPEIEQIFKILERCGWDYRSRTFFAPLNTCRLVVNTYKHGRGKSMDELIALRPDLFHHPLAEMKIDVGQDDHFDHEWLEISEADVRAFASAMEEFWREFPTVMTSEHGVIRPAKVDEAGAH